jgi:hypothetical protein
MLRKTAAFTAASIAGVILAGGAAVGANIGILNAADSNELGQLSAEAPLDAPTETTSLIRLVAPIDESNVHTYSVDIAGAVSVETTGSGLRLVEVGANPGWTWEDTTSRADAVTVTFTAAGDTLEFEAELLADGTIEPSVTRPAAPSAVPPNGTASSFDDDDHGSDDDGYDDDGSDDDDGFDDESEDDEHEGRDDDD